MGTNLGKWDDWYSDLREAQPYEGIPLNPTSPDTYQLGAEFLLPCSLVEDWGCGKGAMRRRIPPGRYRGIDGSHTPFADVIADLATYRSDVPGIFMRHVIEHDYRWKQILDNAVASFSERMVLILFTPLVPETKRLTNSSVDHTVPDLAFSLEGITSRFADARWAFDTKVSDTQYNTETIFYLDRT